MKREDIQTIGYSTLNAMFLFLFLFLSPAVTPLLLRVRRLSRMKNKGGHRLGVLINSLRPSQTLKYHPTYYRPIPAVSLDYAM